MSLEPYSVHTVKCSCACVFSCPTTFEWENVCAIDFFNWILCKVSHIIQYDICQMSTHVTTEIYDATHEKAPNRQNGVISMVVQRTYQGIKQNKNHSKILSTFRGIEFKLAKF